ncbi:MAG: hypothetical protein ACK5RO_07415, partial [Pseudobdellovibrionaceae bacterium]
MSAQEIFSFNDLLAEFYVYEIKGEPKYVFPKKNGKVDLNESPERVFSKLSPSEKLEKLEQILQKYSVLSKSSEKSAKIAFQAKSLVQFFDLIYSEACSGKLEYLPSPMKISTFARDEKTGIEQLSFRAEIADSLKQAVPQPVQISFCSEILTQFDFRGVSSSPAVIQSCARHSALIVGARSRRGRCEYLVRDSYGVHSCQS